MKADPVIIKVYSQKSTPWLKVGEDLTTTKQNLTLACELFFRLSHKKREKIKCCQEK